MANSTQAPSPALLGFVGVGKMGSALLEGALRSGFCRDNEVLVFDPVLAATESLTSRFDVRVAASNEQLFDACDIVVLCVKPQDVEATIAQCGRKKGLLLISIAAGISIASLESWTAQRHRVVRVMPNTPALVGKSAAGYALGENVTQDDAAAVTRLLDSVGIAVEVREEQLDAVTGLSGSGPAYVLTMIEALADGGVLQGLPKPLALRLAAQTVSGAAELFLQSELHPAQLKDSVTSPGGTTIAGLAELERCGFRSALIEAVRAATERCRELGASDEHT